MECVFQQKERKSMCVEYYHNSRWEISVWTLKCVHILWWQLFELLQQREKKVLCVSLIWFRFKWKPDLFPTHNNMNSQEQKLESPTSDGAMLAYWWVNDSKNDKLSNTIWNILVALILYYLLNVITASRIKGIYKKTNTVTNTPCLLTDFVRDICRLLSKNS